MSLYFVQTGGYPDWFWRRNSVKIIPAATLAFRDSVLPFWGMENTTSHAVKRAGRMPCASLPIRMAQFRRKSTSHNKEVVCIFEP